MSIDDQMANESPELVDQILDKVGGDKAVRRLLPDGGRIHLDRPLPFLAVHRSKPEKYATAAERVTIAISAYATWPLGGDSSAMGREIVVEATAKLKDQLGEFMVVELYNIAPDDNATNDSAELSDYRFLLSHSDDELARHCTEKLVDDLDKLKLDLREPDVEIIPRPADLGEVPWKQSWIALGIPRIYDIPGDEGIYPGLMHALETGLLDALLKSLCHVVGQSYQKTPDHYRALGRSGFVQAARNIDMKLDEVATSFDFLLSVSPINTEAAWKKFKASSYEKPPRFRYRPLEIDISQQKRSLFEIQIDRAEDPLLEKLFREKQREIDIQLTMLGCRGTESFSYASVMLYGTVEERLAQQASEVLDKINAIDGPAQNSDDEGSCDCFDIREAAEQLCALYRKDYPDFKPEIIIRDDVAGLLVSGHRMMISRHTEMKKSRLDALLSHEVSIHLLTYFTGNAQGLRMFRNGLAGYEGIQEGLGVFAEFCVDGLSMARVKLLAARVVSVNAMLNHATFIEAFRLLHNRYGFSARGAFNITSRVYRSGGLAKDAIYFRSFAQLLGMLADGQDLDPFWFGKIDSVHIDSVEELHSRGFLTTPPVIPEFLSRDQARKNIERAREGLAIIDLI